MEMALVNRSVKMFYKWDFYHNLYHVGVYVLTTTKYVFVTSKNFGFSRIDKQLSGYRSSVLEG